MHALRQRTHGTAHGFLLRPGGLVYHGGGGVRRVGTALQQSILHLVHQTDGQENHHSGPVGGKTGQLFPLGHRGAAFHAGDDHGLAHGGQGVFGIQCRRRAAEAGHAGRVIVGDAVGVQCIHLLPDSPVQAGVAGVQAHGDFAVCLHGAHHIQHLFQRHLGAVVNGAAGFCQSQQGRVDQTARVDDAISLLQQGCAPPSDQVRGTGPRAYKVYHSSYSFTSTVAKYPALLPSCGGRAVERSGKIVSSGRPQLHTRALRLNAPWASRVSSRAGS